MTEDCAVEDPVSHVDSSFFSTTCVFIKKLSPKTKNM